MKTTLKDKITAHFRSKFMDVMMENAEIYDDLLKQNPNLELQPVTLKAKRFIYARNKTEKKGNTDTYSYKFWIAFNFWYIISLFTVKGVKYQ